MLFLRKIYTISKKLVQNCWPCFHTYKVTKTCKFRCLWNPFQEIVFNLNFAQNLNLFIFLTYLNRFSIDLPFKNLKQAEHVTNILLHSVLQTFYIKKKYIPIMNLVSDQQIDLKLWHHLLNKFKIKITKKHV